MPTAGSKGPKRTVRDSFAVVKELEVWRQHVAGITLAEIAATPGPWGERMYADSSGAAKALVRVRKRARDETTESVEEWRHDHRERLTDLFRRSIEVADRPHPIVDRLGNVAGFDDGVTLTAIRTGNGVLDSLAKLDGLDANTKFEMTGADGQPIEVRIGELLRALPRVVVTEQPKSLEP